MALLKESDNIDERTISGELETKISKYIKCDHINCGYNRMTGEHGNQIPKRIGLNPNNKSESQ